MPPESLIDGRGVLVDSFATGLLRTEIRDLGVGTRPARFDWIRSAGELRTGPLPGPPGDLRSMLLAVTHPDLHAVLPERLGEANHYAVPGASTMAKLLCHVSSPQLAEPISRAMNGLGTVLRQHGGARPADDDGDNAFDGKDVDSSDFVDRKPVGAPAGLSRLATWLRTADGPGDARQLWAVLSQRLGPNAIERAQASGSHLTAGRNLVVGASLGSVILAADGGPAVLLVGEDTGCATSGLDLGWLLGELTELRRMLVHAAPLPVRADMVGVLDSAAVALLRGYGPIHPGSSVRDVVLAASMRVLLHAHDFAAYVSTSDQVIPLLDLSGELNGVTAPDGLTWPLLP